MNDCLGRVRSITLACPWCLIDSRTGLVSDYGLFDDDMKTHNQKLLRFSRIQLKFNLFSFISTVISPKCIHVLSECVLDVALPPGLSALLAGEDSNDVAQLQGLLVLFD